MKKDLSLWQFIYNHLLLKEKVMLLVVTESSGSSPGRAGFKMAVSEDNDFRGSIGGGIMEVKLVELAKQLLKEDFILPQIKQQIHRKNAPRYQSGMICSGEQTVIYFRLEQKHLGEIDKIVNVVDGYGSGVISISFLENTPLFFVTEKKSNTHQFDFHKNDVEEFGWHENIGYPHQLFIIGGGHCALALSDIMSKFDFYIHVIDDRPELNTMLQNTFAHNKVVLENYQLISSMIPSGQDTYVVIMTLGYRTDLSVLLQLADKQLAYLGLLGSESKITALKEELEKTGFPISILNEMHAPVGLKINSHTPEEIAVSIAAELIAVKNRV